MNDASELRPCPFCGSEAEFSVGKFGDGKDWHYIECTQCEAVGPKVSYADHGIRLKECLADAWNRRPAQPAEAGRVEVRDLERDFFKMTPSEVLAALTPAPAAQEAHLSDEIIDRFWPECTTVSCRAILRAEWAEMEARSARATPPYAQEPVAYQVRRGGEARVVLAKFVSEAERLRPTSNGWTHEPLYTTPPAAPTDTALVEENARLHSAMLIFGAYLLEKGEAFRTDEGAELMDAYDAALAARAAPPDAPVKGAVTEALDDALRSYELTGNVTLLVERVRALAGGRK